MSTTKRKDRELQGGKAIPLPKGEVGRVAAKLVQRFQRCDAGKVTPLPRYVGNCESTPIGRHGRTTVCAVPESTDHWLAKYDLTLGANYAPRHGQVTVKVNSTQCAEPKRWTSEIRRALRHELTHAVDPYVHVRKTPYAQVRARTPQIEHSLLRPDVCGYFLDPVEVTARIAEVEEQLLSSKARRTIERAVRKGDLKPGELHHILHESPVYLEILPCLNVAPKIKRRFYQLAARLWASGVLGPRPK